MYRLVMSSTNNRISDTNLSNTLWKRQKTMLSRESVLRQEIYKSQVFKRPYHPITVEDHHSVAIGNVFKPGIRPLVNKWGATAIAQNPEEHLEVQRRRQKKQNKGYKKASPTQLLPIDIKSLTKANHSLDSTRNETATSLDKPSKGSNTYSPSDEEPLKQQQHSFINQSKAYRKLDILDMEYTPSRLSRYSIDRSLQLEPMTKSLLERAITSDSLNEDRRYANKRRAGFGHLSQEMTQLRLTKKLPEFNMTINNYIKYCTSNSVYSHEIQSRGHKSDRTPLLQNVQIDPVEDDRSWSRSLSPSELSHSTQKSIIIQLPEIQVDYTPAITTSNICRQEDSNKVSKQAIGSKISWERQAKQRELRKKELSNLFDDIKELDSLNGNLMRLIGE